MTKKRILLFDDDYESMQPLMNFLQASFGYEVDLTAEVSVIERLSTVKYDLVCVDFMIHPETPNAHDELVDNVRYPETEWQETGREFLKRLRRGDYRSKDDGGTSNRVPVIVLSATATENDVLDANYILDKPFDLGELSDAIVALIGEQAVST